MEVLRKRWAQKLKGMSESWRGGHIVEQGGIKTGRKAVKSQTSLVSLLMRQVVTFLEVFLAAQVGPVPHHITASCAVPLFAPSPFSCHVEAMHCDVILGRQIL